MKSFLHIGTEKTGTTTLQEFFHLNRDRLRRQGYIYTKSAGEKNNRGLSVAAYAPDKRDDFTRRFGIHTNAQLTSYQKSVLANLSEELKGHSDKTVIFSSEHLQSRLWSTLEVENLRNVLIELGMSDITVIVYLRNPSETANSLYSTSVREGAWEPSPPPPDDEYYRHICNHKQTLQLFGSVFGKEAIAPRIFSRQEMKNGSVIEDFLSLVGIETTGLSDYAVPENKNQGLSATSLELLRRINRQVPSYVDDRPNPLRGNIVTYIKDLFPGPKYRMPEHLSQQYDEAFSDSNEWVRKHYFPEKERLFAGRRPAPESSAALTDDQLQQIAGMVSRIWLDKQRHIDMLTPKTFHGRVRKAAGLISPGWLHRVVNRSHK